MEAVTEWIELVGWHWLGLWGCLLFAAICFICEMKKNGQEEHD